MGRVSEKMATLQVLLLGLLAAIVQSSPTPQNFGIKSSIVGGQEAEPHQFPWQISLKYLDIWPHHYHTCGATIVDSMHIVCAAHCIHGRQKSWFKVVAGAHNIHAILPEATIQKRNVAEMWHHEGYDSSIITNDVSLLQLEEPFASTLVGDQPVIVQCHPCQISCSTWRCQ